MNYIKKIKRERTITYVPRQFNGKDKKFWSQYEISSKELIEDKVIPIDLYKSTSRKGKPFVIRPFDIMYAYTDFDNGKVNFKKVQETKNFQDGITRLEKGIEKGYNISLMCSEKEAFDCHRFGLVAEFLSQQSIQVNHIYPEKVVSQQELEQRLLKKYDKQIPKIDLFNPNVNLKEQLEKAYKLRNIDIAYNAFTQEGDDE